MEKKNVVQNILIGIFILLIIAGGFVLVRGYTSGGGNKAIVNASGRIEGDEYNAGCKVSGKVHRILVSEGQDVRKGQLLAQLYSQQIQSALESAQKDVIMCRNRLLQAEIALTQAREHSGATFNSASANLVMNSSQLNKASAAYRQNEAQMEQSRMGITQAKLDFQQAKANQVKAAANLNYLEKQYKRFKNLLSEDAIARTQFESAETQYIAAREECVLAGKQVEKARVGVEESKKSFRVSQANVDFGMAGVREGEAGVNVGRANLDLARIEKFDVRQREEDVKNARETLYKAEAMLQSARADVEDTRVYAPTTGTIIKKIVEPGEVIAAGTPVVTLVNMDALYLRVFLATETVGKLKIGNEAKIVPDALPNERVDGKRPKISNKAEFTPKNVETKQQRAKLVFEVKIAVSRNKERALKPGMPSEAYIRIDDSIPWESVKIP